MKMVITHIKNESYLLKWWLHHHKNKFDHGIVIDYNSTDNSRDLVHEICPEWEIVQSRNNCFDSLGCDQEVVDIQSILYRRYPNTWFIALCVTEFLIGDTRKLDNIINPTAIPVPCDIMVDHMDHLFVEPDENSSLIKQRTHGVPLEYNENNRYNMHNSTLCKLQCQTKQYVEPRFMRALHNYPIDYLSVIGPGRHAWSSNGYSEDFRVLWYGLSPFTHNLIKRKLSIDPERSESDRKRGAGDHHLCNRYDLIKRWTLLTEHGAQDLRELIEKYEPDL